MQVDLFQQQNQREIIQLSPGASVLYYKQWLPEHQADALLQCLMNELEWFQPTLNMAGKAVPIPRLQSWFGDSQAVMKYSGQRFEPQPWHPQLSMLRAKLVHKFDLPLNSVLVNLYRDGQDSVGWHADDEAELGRNPQIVSLTLGATRRFLLKPKPALINKDSSFSKVKHVFDLGHGDLLFMMGNCQTGWQHALPKTQRSVENRVNLTFRNVKNNPCD